MTPQDMIARYVQAVGRRLPLRMRADICAELQDLLMDGLRERAVGGAPSEQMAADLLSSFGPPREAALRYHTPPAIIEPADTSIFTKIAASVLVALTVLAASIVLSAPHATGEEWRAIANRVSGDYVRSSLIVLGALLVLFWVRGALSRARPAATAWKPASLPPVRDHDQVSRIGGAAALAAWTVGFLILMRPLPFFDLLMGGHAPAVLGQVFAYDDTFMRDRAPVLWGLLGATLLVYAWATVEGRWTKLTRRLDLVLAAAVALVCLWVIVSGPIFTAPATDQAMKFWTALIEGFVVVDVCRRIDEAWRQPKTPPPARAAATP